MGRVKHRTYGVGNTRHHNWFELCGVCMNPKMLLIFEKDYADKVSTGELVAFGAHAAMNFSFELRDARIGTKKINNPSAGFTESTGYFKNNICRNTQQMFNDWIGDDYKKIVLTTNLPLDELYYNLHEDFKKVSYLMQYSSHDKKPKCLAIFGDSKDLNKISKGMEMLK